MFGGTVQAGSVLAVESDWLSFLLADAVKGVVLLALAFCITALMRRSTATARHFVWTLAVFGVLALPLLSTILPAWPVLPGWFGVKGGVVTAQTPAVTASAGGIQSPEAAVLKETSADMSFDGQIVGRTPRRETGDYAADSTFVQEHRIDRSTESEAGMSGTVAAQQPDARIRLARGVVAIWLFGAMIVVSFITFANCRLHWLVRRWTRTGDGRLWREVCRTTKQLECRDSITLYVGSVGTLPMTWGFFRPKLVLPSDAKNWRSERLRSVLTHEFAHIFRRDCLTQFVASLTCAMYWFNPLIWLAARRMQSERERACDDRVLLGGISGPDYASHLLEVARASRTTVPSSAAAVGIVRHSPLEERIRALLDRKMPRHPLSAARIALCIVLLLTFVVPLSMAESSPGPSAASGSAVQQSPTLPADIPRRVAQSGNPAAAAATTAVPKAESSAVEDWRIVSLSLRGYIYTIDWSPDGQLIAFGESDIVRIYDAASMDLVRVLIGHQKTIRSVAFSPNGKQLASTSDDGTVRVWDVNGKPGSVLKGHGEPVQSVSWSPDGKKLVSAGQDGTLRIWTAQGQAGVVLARYESPMMSVSWSPDGSRILAGDRNHKVRLVNADGTGQIALDGHLGPVSCVAWHPDGKKFATGSHGFVDPTQTGSSPAVATVRIWNADGTAGPVLQGHQRIILQVAWSPDGNRLASCGDDRQIFLWNADGTPLRRIPGGYRGVEAIAWSPDGEKLASASRHQFRVFDTNGREVAKLGDRNEFVQSVAWSPDGNQISAGCEDGSLRLFSPDGAPGPVAQLGDFPIHEMDWSPDSGQLATGNGDRTVRLFDDDLTAGPVLSGHRSNVFSVSWNSDGSRLASSSFDRSIRFWDSDGTPGRVLQQVHDGNIHGLAWSPDGEWLVSASFDSTAQVWTSDGEEGPFLEGHTGPLNTVAWCPDSSKFATGGMEDARIWNTDGELIEVLPAGIDGDILSLAWSPDGRNIAAGLWTTKILQWTADGKPGPVFDFHPAPVVAVDWSPDSSKILSGSYDSTLRVCDAKSGALLWTAYILENGESVTLDSQSQLAYGDPEVLDADFRYVVSRKDGSVEIMQHSQFAAGPGANDSAPQ